MPSTPESSPLSRRTLLRGAAGLGLAAAGGTLLSACSSGGDDQVQSRAGGTTLGVEGPPETTTIRVPNVFPVSCPAALAVARPFLEEEGFTDIQYPKMTVGHSVDALPAGEVDFHLGYAATHLLRIDAGLPTVLLAGAHVGCWQVFVGRGIRSLRELKGKRIGVYAPRGPDGIFLAMNLGNVGIDLREDVEVVSYQPADAAALLSSGRVDALAAFPPHSQDLRARGIGTVVVNSMVDRPWSNYFCCMATVNRNWMERHPIATKRALRALLRAADVVDAQPGHAAHIMVEEGFTNDLKLAKQNLQEIPYDVWRRYDPADTVRYLALRMKEAGLVKESPETLLARGTDFTYLAELRRELGPAPKGGGTRAQHH